jgi:hypothetical protein
MMDYAMTSIANVRTVLFPPLEFTISLALDRSYTVREKHGRDGGQFADLSTAILSSRTSAKRMVAGRSRILTGASPSFAPGDDLSRRRMFFGVIAALCPFKC